MIYQPHMEQSDWSEFTTMVQVAMQYCLARNISENEIWQLGTKSTLHKILNLVIQYGIAMHIRKFGGL